MKRLLVPLFILLAGGALITIIVAVVVSTGAEAGSDGTGADRESTAIGIGNGATAHDHGDSRARAPVPLVDQRRATGVDAGFLAPPLIAGGLAVGYSDGRLRAYSLTDGSEAWVRSLPADALPFLGIQLVSDAGPGIQVEVVPGSSAAGAGIRDGDRVIRFNEIDIEEFAPDLVEALRESEPGAPFTCVVLRSDPATDDGQRRLEIGGVLGARPLHPVAANDEIAVVTRPALHFGLSAAATASGDPDPHAEIIDVASGRVLWRAAVPGAWHEGERAPATPLLLDDDLGLIEGAAGLVALDPRRPDAPLWQLPTGDERDFLILSGGYVAVEQVEAQRLQLSHPSDQPAGDHAPLDLPATLFHGAILDAGCLVAGHADAGLGCWDLATGQLRWRWQGETVRPVAIAAGSVYVIDAGAGLLALDLATGEERARFAQWPMVEAVARVEDRLFLHGQNPAGEAVLAAIDLVDSSVLWQAILPAVPAARSQLAPLGTGVALALGSEERGGGVQVYDAGGALVAVRRMTDDQRLAVDDRAGYLSGRQGVEILRPGLPAAGPALPMSDLGSGDLGELGAALAAHHPWHRVGSAAYQVARSGQGLILNMRVDWSSDGLVIDIGGESTAASPARLSLQPHRSPIPHGPFDGWKITGVRLISRDEPGWIVALRISPDPAGGALPTRVRAEADGEIDGPPAPWWWRASWRPLIEAEAPQSP